MADSQSQIAAQFNEAIEVLARFKGNHRGNERAVDSAAENASIALQKMRSSKSEDDEIDQKHRSLIARLIELERCRDSELELWRLFVVMKNRYDPNAVISLMDVQTEEEKNRWLIRGIALTKKNRTPRSVFSYINLMVLFFQTFYLGYRHNIHVINASVLAKILDQRSTFGREFASQTPKLKSSSSKVLAKVLNRIITLRNIAKLSKALLILKSLRLLNCFEQQDLLNSWVTCFYREVQILTSSNPANVYTLLRSDLLMVLRQFDEKLKSGLVQSHRNEVFETLAQIAADFSEFKLSSGTEDEYDWSIYVNSFTENASSAGLNSSFLDMLHLITSMTSVSIKDIDIGFSSLQLSQLENDTRLKDLLLAVNCIQKYTDVDFPTYSRFVSRLLNQFNEYFCQNDVDIVLTRKIHLTILDTITIQIKDLIESLQADEGVQLANYDFIYAALAVLSDTLKKCGQVKRYRNISNLYYNLTLKVLKVSVNDEDVRLVSYISSNIKNCLQIEHIIYLADSSKSNLNQYESKLQKSIAILQKFRQFQSILDAVADFLPSTLDHSVSESIDHLKSTFPRTLIILFKCLLNSQAESKPLTFKFSEELSAALYIQFQNFLKTFKCSNKAEVSLKIFNQLSFKSPALKNLCLLCWLNNYGESISSNEAISQISIAEEDTETSPVVQLSLRFWILLQSPDSSKIINLYNSALSWLEVSCLSNSSKDTLLSELEWTFFYSFIMLLDAHELQTYCCSLSLKYSETRGEKWLSSKQNFLLVCNSAKSQLSLGLSKLAYTTIISSEKLLKKVCESDASPLSKDLYHLLLMISKFDFYLQAGDLKNSESLCKTILDFASHSKNFFKSVVNFINLSEVTDEYISLMVYYSRFSSLVAKMKFQNGSLAAIYDLRRSIRVIMVTVRKLEMSSLMDTYIKVVKIQLSSLITNLYQSFIEICLYHGFSKDCDYYHKELIKFVFSDDETVACNAPLIKFKSAASIVEFALLSGKFEIAKVYFAKLNAVLEDLSFELPKYLELAKYRIEIMFHNSSIDEANRAMVFESYKKFLGLLNEMKNPLVQSQFAELYRHTSDKDLDRLNVSRSEIENSIITRLDNDNLFKYDYIDAIDESNSSSSLLLYLKQRLLTAKKELSEDPVLAALQDSATSIPSQDLGAVNAPRCEEAHNATQELSKSVQTINSLRRFEYMKRASNLNWHSLSYVSSYSVSLQSAIVDSHSFSRVDSELITVKNIVQLAEIARYSPFQNEIMISSYEEDNTEVLPRNATQGIDRDYDIQTEDPKQLFRDIKAYLPDSWKVISIDFCPFTGDLMLTHLTRSTEPFIVRLPLSRFTSRDFNEGTITFTDAKKEFEAIIEKNNESTRFSRDNQNLDNDTKKKWWKNRYVLNNKLERLLKDIEYSWLGGFRGLFSTSFGCTNVHTLLKFKKCLTKIFEDNLPSRRKFRRHSRKGSLQRSQSVPNMPKSSLPAPSLINNFIAELYLNVGDPEKLKQTELLEDLIYFVLDLLSFRGEENAYDEIDIDQIYVDIKDLLTEFKEANGRNGAINNSSNISHTVLVIGKSSQNLPWESLPCLKKNSVSRMPSLKLLLQALKSHSAKDLVFDLSTMTGHYVLNPGKDLKRTQEVFEEKLHNSLPNWSNSVGTAPSEDSFIESLTNSELFIYIGHGGGEHYVRNSRLKKIPFSSKHGSKCAAALLLGCSSGSLTDNSQLEPNGTVFSYLIAGSPMILANLWDVTDKDIDRFSVSVFEKWGLFDNESDKENINLKSTKMTKSTTDNHQFYNICEAVSASRDVCLLKHLNGAAPVVYGLPFYIKK